jgi:diadenosine tetraphosphate (Ap4A) HIT family hydrolase
MVVPVEQIADFETLPPKTYRHLMDVAQQMARRLKKIYSPPKVALAIVGMEVAHVHVHLFPLYAEAEMNPAAAKHPSFEEISAEADKLRQALSETPIE